MKKNLFKSLLVVCVMASVAACNNDEDVQPETPTPKPPQPQGPVYLLTKETTFNPDGDILLTMSYEYNAQNQLKESAFNTSENVSRYDYDNQNRLTKVVSEFGTTTFDYVSGSLVVATTDGDRITNFQMENGKVVEYKGEDEHSSSAILRYTGNNVSFFDIMTWGECSDNHEIFNLRYDDKKHPFSMLPCKQYFGYLSLETHDPATAFVFYNNLVREDFSGWGFENTTTISYEYNEAGFPTKAIVIGGEAGRNHTVTYEYDIR